MKKVISIIVALALMLGLSIAATPVLADVTAAEVGVNPTDQFAEAEYTVTFNITGDLIAGTTSITVEFPLGTVLPGEWEDGDITVGDIDVAKTWVSVSGQKVTFYSPLRVDAPGPVVVVFKSSSGIKNPPAGDYNLWVNTSAPVDQTRVKSEKYEIGLADHSTYEFVVDGLVVNDTQVMIHVDQPVEVDVTLRTLLEGVAGYDNVQKQIQLISAPAHATVKVGIDGEDIELTASSEALWGDSFNIPRAYSNTWTDATMEFDRVGIYTIAFRLLDEADAELVREDVSVTVAGVSFVVELNKGWNLMSLPIIPDNSAIATVLAGIGTNWQTKVEYVWYYDPTITDPTKRWRSYKPGLSNPTLNKIEDGKAYWIHMEDAAQLTVVGVAIVLPGEVPPTYSVRAGWNMVGFKSIEPMKAGDYLEGTDLVRTYGYDLKQGGWFPLAASANMTAGLGYWVAFSEPGIIYP